MYEHNDACAALTQLLESWLQSYDGDYQFCLLDPSGVLLQPKHKGVEPLSVTLAQVPGLAEWGERGFATTHDCKRLVRVHYDIAGGRVTRPVQIFAVDGGFAIVTA
jgi:hypothetical protein